MRTRIKEALERYRDHSIKPGDFLTAVLCNDLKMAFFKADSQSTKELPEIVSWCHWELPGGSWGSVKEVREWIAG